MGVGRAAAIPVAPSDAHQRSRAKQRQAIDGHVEAMRLALDGGRIPEAIGHMRLVEALCVHAELAEVPPPSSGVLLDIDAVSQKTGYSKSRLRHMGQRLAGYWKSPTGKVGWWSGPLEAWLAAAGAKP